MRPPKMIVQSASHVRANPPTLPKNVRAIRLNILQEAGHLLLDLHDEDGRDSANTRYLILVNTVKNFVIQREYIFQFIIRNSGLGCCYVGKRMTQNSATKLTLYLFK